MTKTLRDLTASRESRFGRFASATRKSAFGGGELAVAQEIADFSLFLSEAGGFSVYISDGGALGELPPAVECAANPNIKHGSLDTRTLGAAKSKPRFRKLLANVLWAD